MNANVLVAEDDDSQRELLVRRLTAAGHVVTEAADGPEAVVRLAAAQFDVLVTDLWMPGQNGLLVVASAKSSSPEVRSFTDSETVQANRRARQLRTFDYEGNEVEMLAHLKIGVADSAVESIRIHFCWDSAKRRIVIGYCGAHLDHS